MHHINTSAREGGFYGDGAPVMEVRDPPEVWRTGLWIVCTQLANSYRNFYTPPALIHSRRAEVQKLLRACC